MANGPQGPVTPSTSLKRRRSQTSSVETLLTNVNKAPRIARTCNELSEHRTDFEGHYSGDSNVGDVQSPHDVFVSEAPQANETEIDVLDEVAGNRNMASHRSHEKVPQLLDIAYADETANSTTEDAAEKEAYVTVSRSAKLNGHVIHTLLKALNPETSKISIAQVDHPPKAWSRITRTCSSFERAVVVIFDKDLNHWAVGIFHVAN